MSQQYFSRLWMRRKERAKGAGARRQARKRLGRPQLWETWGPMGPCEGQGGEAAQLSSRGDDGASADQP